MSGKMAFGGKLAVAVPIVTTLLGMMGNTKAAGAAEALNTLNNLNVTYMAATGGQSSIFSLAEKHLGPQIAKVNEVIQKCAGDACKATGQENVLAAAATALKGHLSAGAEAVANGASGVVAQAAGKGATRA